MLNTGPADMETHTHTVIKIYLDYNIFKCM